MVAQQITQTPFSKFYYNPNRSGSIEGTSPTTGGPTLIATLSSGATASGDNSAASVGTWKLIKGKVTQTLEDIKSSKHQQQHQHHSTTNIPIIIADTQSGAAGWTNEPDSDTEGITLNTSISEELPLDQDQKQHNSDSDIEIEILQHDGGGDLSIAGTAAGGSSSAATERSRLRRGLAHIKSKVKAKQQQHHHQHAMHKKDATATPSAPISIRSGFLRRRTNADANEASTSGQPPIDHQVASSKRQSVSAPEIPIASGKAKRGILLARKDVEIESGVEVHEDMIPATDAAAAATTTTTTDSKDGPQRSEPTDSENQRLRSSLDLPFQEATNYSRDPQIPPISSEDSDSNPTLWTAFSMNSIASRYTKNKTVHVLFTPLMLALGFTVLFVMPLHDFLRGVLATVLFIILLESSSPYFYWALEHFVLKTHPERIPFKIPDYTNMPICEIPAVEEHKTIKTYAGWLNETNSYDPNTFSFSLTRSVYVRLDGTILKMSGTNARIPKRRMWNELPIDRTKVLFTDHRSYDLRECRIELLPVGLAKKRYFNRKYPIQLIIKNTCSDNERLPEQSSMHTEVSIKLEAKEAKTALGGGSTPPNTEDPENHIDFGATVMQADLQDLRNSVNPDTELNDITVPCGDEVRLLLFARCDREKEDWYRRFICASKGRVHEQDLQVPQARFVEDTDLQLAAAREAVRLTSGGSKRKRKEGEERQLQINDNSSQTSLHEDGGINTPDANEDAPEEDCTPDVPKEEGFEGMIMSSDVARNPPDYVRFMTVYQKACNQTHIPVHRSTAIDVRTHHHGHRHRKSRRSKRQEDELWKGIDQSLFLGPSGSIVWANVLVGRCLFSWLHDEALHEKIKDFMQKKLNSIKLPSFMEEVIITNIYLGQSPMLVHRVSQPMLDERGVWLDADITYEGLSHITVTTKLNLLRVRAKSKAPQASENAPLLIPDPQLDSNAASEEVLRDANSSVIYDSDAESSGGSSTESESPPPGAANENAGGNEFFQNSPGNARRIFKIVDRIAASNLFQYATELPYVQRAMENMSANITLRVDLKGLVARGTLNVPPPPSDRIWMCFRGPPRLWISTKPQVGDKSVDWSIVTNVIESKLCEAVNKFLVYPNMVDFTIPFLSKPSYDDEPPASSN